MNISPRKLALYIALACLVLIAVLWISGLREPSEINAPKNKIKNSATVNPMQVRTSPDVSPTPQSIEQQEKLKDGKGFSILASLSSAKIEFYGTVIDQDNKPLPGVEVIGTTGSKTGFMQDEQRVFKTTTDSNGFFAFNGFSGDGLVVDLKKEGYNFHNTARQFLYSQIDPDHRRFVPDKNNPVIFQMWKRNGAEPMIYYVCALPRASVKNMPVCIDLTKGKVVKSGGDIIIDVKWDPEHPGGYDFQWIATIEAPQGGIVEGGSNTRFVAPSEGYKSKIEYRFSARSQPDLHRSFYIKCRNAQAFSRVDLWLENQPGPSAVDLTLSTWLNPSGSRNLEYDPTKRINP